jgi:hypothetical protein
MGPAPEQSEISAARGREVALVPKAFSVLHFFLEATTQCWFEGNGGDDTFRNSEALSSGCEPHPTKAQARQVGSKALHCGG